MSLTASCHRFITARTQERVVVIIIIIPIFFFPRGLESIWIKAEAGRHIGETESEDEKTVGVRLWASFIFLIGLVQGRRRLCDWLDSGREPGEGAGWTVCPGEKWNFRATLFICLRKPNDFADCPIIHTVWSPWRQMMAYQTSRPHSRIRQLESR